MKCHLLINKTQSQISNPLSVLTCRLYYDKSFENKPAFVNFVPQLLEKIITRAQRDFIDLI